MDKTKDDICDRHDVNDQQGGEEVDDAIIDGDRDWVFAISSSGGGGGETEIVFLGINLELLLLVIIMIILLVEIKKIEKFTNSVSRRSWEALGEREALLVSIKIVKMEARISGFT